MVSQVTFWLSQPVKKASCMARDFMVGILKHLAGERSVDGSRLPTASKAKERRGIAPHRTGQPKALALESWERGTKRNKKPPRKDAGVRGWHSHGNVLG